MDPVGEYFYTAKHIGSREVTYMFPEEIIDVSTSASPPAPHPNWKQADGPCKSSCKMVYWHNRQNKWIAAPTASFVSISPGVPVLLYTVARGWMPSPALLVGDEDNVDSWRLYFRYTGIYLKHTLLVVLHCGCYFYLYSDVLLFIISINIFYVPDLGSEIETKIDIGDSGVSNGASIKQLSASELTVQQTVYEKKIFNARRGDYLWVWLRTTDEIVQDQSLQRRYLPSNVLPSPGRIAPYLLHCEVGAGETGSTTVFTFHDEHRR